MLPIKTLIGLATMGPRVVSLWNTLNPETQITVDALLRDLSGFLPVPPEVKQSITTIMGQEVPLPEKLGAIFALPEAQAALQRLVAGKEASKAYTPPTEILVKCDHCGTLKYVDLLEGVSDEDRQLVQSLNNN